MMIFVTGNVYIRETITTAAMGRKFYYNDSIDHYSCYSN